MNHLTICNAIISGTQELLQSKSFMDSHRIKNRFVRKRNLSMYQTVLYLLFSSKASLFQNIAAIKDELPVLSFPNVSKQAISKARQGIFSSLFKTLFTFAVTTYYQKISTRKLWHGYHLFAIDGSKLQLPTSKSNFDEFGEMFSLKNPKRRWSMALGSTIYDVLEDIIVDASIHNYNYAERKAAKKHLEVLESMHLHNQSIVILDRGYYSEALFRHFINKEYYCLMRLKSNLKIIRQSKNDAITTINGNPKKYSEPVSIRVISIVLDSGETEYLATNIMDPSFTPEMFKELYFKRWKIESKYNEIKNQLQIEEFNGATSISIHQEFYINLLLSNLSAIVKNGADQKISAHKKTKNSKKYHANRSFILGRIKKMLPKLLCGQPCYYTLDFLFEDAFKNRSQIQPDRKCERKRRPKSDRCHFRNRKTSI